MVLFVRVEGLTQQEMRKRNQNVALHAFKYPYNVFDRESDAMNFTQK